MRSLPTLEQELIFISSNQITAPNSGKGAKGIRIETQGTIRKPLEPLENIRNNIYVINAAYRSIKPYFSCNRYPIQELNH